MSEHEGRPDLLRKRARAIMVTRVWRGAWSVIVLVAVVTMTINILQTLENRRILREHSGKDDRLEFAIYCADRPGQQTIDEIRRCVDEMMKEK